MKVNMNPNTLFEHLRKFDTPTIANALEIVQEKRSTRGFTRQTYLCAFPKLPAIVGFARTATIRCSTPYDPAARRKNQVAYYEHVAQGDQPTIAVPFTPTETMRYVRAGETSCISPRVPIAGGAGVVAGAPAGTGVPWPVAP